MARPGLGTRWLDRSWNRGYATELCTCILVVAGLTQSTMTKRDIDFPAASF
jgi:hypothetical protein